jgi:hypothetical protein
VASVPIPKFQTPPILAGRFEPLRGVGGHLPECGDHLLPNLVVLIEDLSPVLLQINQTPGCPSPKLDSSAFSTISLVFLPTKIFEIKI